MKRALKILGTVLVASFLFYATLTLVSTVSSNREKIDQAQATTGLVAQAAVINCEIDRKARVQYRRRAILEARLFILESRSNTFLAGVLGHSLRNPENQGEGTPKQRAYAQRAYRLFARVARLERKLATRIEILPLRPCEHLRDAIERAIGRHFPQ